MQFLKQLLEQSRVLTILYDNLPAEIKTAALYQQTSDYLEKYAAFNNITAEETIAVYTSYIIAYNKHAKLFVKTGKYPPELGINDFSLSRQQYDTVLTLSILFTAHRFRIMQLLKEKAAPLQKALFIGLGSGLEIELTKNAYQEIHGYDLSVDPFLYSQFKDASFNAALYTGQFNNYFDAVYLVELLEHLETPYDLLHTCYSSLKKGGHIFLTTATDIPQFDHLYNFPLNHDEFESRILKMGYSIVYKEMIPHHYLSLDIQPCNHFYILKKV